MEQQKIEVPTDLYIEALKEQRNAAQDQAALAMARSVDVQRKCAMLEHANKLLSEENERLVAEAKGGTNARTD
jgi:hypothetical protein